MGQTIIRLNPGPYEIPKSADNIHVYIICEDKMVAGNYYFWKKSNFYFKEKVATYEMS